MMKLKFVSSIVILALITTGCGKQDNVIEDIDKELNDLKEKYHLEIENNTEVEKEEVEKEKVEKEKVEKEDAKKEEDVKDDNVEDATNGDTAVSNNEILTELKSSDYEKEYKGKGYDFDKENNTLFISLGLTEDSINGIIVEEVKENGNNLVVNVEPGKSGKGELGIYYKVNKEYENVVVIYNDKELKEIK